MLLAAAFCREFAIHCPLPPILNVFISFEAHSQSNFIILRNVGLIVFNPCQFSNTSANTQIYMNKH